jgi:hypothetical protein
MANRMIFGSNPAAPTADAATAQKEEKKLAEFWMNPGQLKEITEDGETYDHMTTLPFGIPLDLMKHAELEGSARKRKLTQAKNDFLDQILAYLRLNLKPGERMYRTMTFEFYRVPPKTATAEEKVEENPYKVKLDWE